MRLKQKMYISWARWVESLIISSFVINYFVLTETLVDAYFKKDSSGLANSISGGTEYLGKKLISSNNNLLLNIIGLSLRLVSPSIYSLGFICSHISPISILPSINIPLNIAVYEEDIYSNVDTGSLNTLAAYIFTFFIGIPISTYSQLKDLAYVQLNTPGQFIRGFIPKAIAILFKGLIKELRYLNSIAIYSNIIYIKDYMSDTIFKIVSLLGYDNIQSLVFSLLGFTATEILNIILKILNKLLYYSLLITKYGFALATGANIENLDEAITLLKKLYNWASVEIKKFVMPVKEYAYGTSWKGFSFISFKALTSPKYLFKALQSVAEFLNTSILDYMLALSILYVKYPFLSVDIMQLYWKYMGYNRDYPLSSETKITKFRNSIIKCIEAYTDSNLNCTNIKCAENINLKDFVQLFSQIRMANLYHYAPYMNKVFMNANNINLKELNLTIQNNSYNVNLILNSDYYMSLINSAYFSEHEVLNYKDMAIYQWLWLPLGIDLSQSISSATQYTCAVDQSRPIDTYAGYMQSLAQFSAERKPNTPIRFHSPIIMDLNPLLKGLGSIGNTVIHHSVEKKFSVVVPRSIRSERSGLIDSLKSRYDEVVRSQMIVRRDVRNPLTARQNDNFTKLMYNHAVRLKNEQNREYLGVGDATKYKIASQLELVKKGRAYAGSTDNLTNINYLAYINAIIANTYGADYTHIVKQATDLFVVEIFQDKANFVDYGNCTLITFEIPDIDILNKQTTWDQVYAGYIIYHSYCTGVTPWQFVDAATAGTGTIYTSIISGNIPALPPYVYLAIYRLHQKNSIQQLENLIYYFIKLPGNAVSNNVYLINLVVHSLHIGSRNIGNRMYHNLNNWLGTSITALNQYHTLLSTLRSQITSDHYRQLIHNHVWRLDRNQRTCCYITTLNGENITQTNLQNMPADSSYSAPVYDLIVIASLGLTPVHKITLIQAYNELYEWMQSSCTKSDTMLGNCIRILKKFTSAIFRFMYMPLRMRFIRIIYEIFLMFINLILDLEYYAYLSMLKFGENYLNSFFTLDFGNYVNMQYKQKLHITNLPYVLLGKESTLGDYQANKNILKYTLSVIRFGNIRSLPISRPALTAELVPGSASMSWDADTLYGHALCELATYGLEKNQINEILNTFMYVKSYIGNSYNILKNRDCIHKVFRIRLFMEKIYLCVNLIIFDILCNVLSSKNLRLTEKLVLFIKYLKIMKIGCGPIYACSNIFAKIDNRFLKFLSEYAVLIDLINYIICTGINFTLFELEVSKLIRVRQINNFLNIFAPILEFYLSFVIFTSSLQGLALTNFISIGITPPDIAKFAAKAAGIASTTGTGIALGLNFMNNVADEYITHILCGGFLAYISYIGFKFLQNTLDEYLNPPVKTGANVPKVELLSIKGMFRLFNLIISIYVKSLKMILVVLLRFFSGFSQVEYVLALLEDLKFDDVFTDLIDFTTKLVKYVLNRIKAILIDPLTSLVNICISILNLTVDRIKKDLKISPFFGPIWYSLYSKSYTEYTNLDPSIFRSISKFFWIPTPFNFFRIYLTCFKLIFNNLKGIFDRFKVRVNRIDESKQCNILSPHSYSDSTSESKNDYNYDRYMICDLEHGSKVSLPISNTREKLCDNIIKGLCQSYGINEIEMYEFDPNFEHILKSTLDKLKQKDKVKFLENVLEYMFLLPYRVIKHDKFILYLVNTYINEYLQYMKDQRIKSMGTNYDAKDLRITSNIDKYIEYHKQELVYKIVDILKKGMAATNDHFVSSPSTHSQVITAIYATLLSKLSGLNYDTDATYTKFNEKFFQVIPLKLNYTVKPKVIHNPLSGQSIILINLRSENYYVNRLYDVDSQFMEIEVGTYPENGINFEDYYVLPDRKTYTKFIKALNESENPAEDLILRRLEHNYIILKVVLQMTLEKIMYKINDIEMFLNEFENMQFIYMEHSNNAQYFMTYYETLNLNLDNIVKDIVLKAVELTDYSSINNEDYELSIFLKKIGEFNAYSFSKIMEFDLFVSKFIDKVIEKELFNELKTYVRNNALSPLYTWWLYYMICPNFYHYTWFIYHNLLNINYDLNLNFEELYDLPMTYNSIFDDMESIYKSRLKIYYKTSIYHSEKGFSSLMSGADISQSVSRQNVQHRRDIQIYMQNLI